VLWQKAGHPFFSVETPRGLPIKIHCTNEMESCPAASGTKASKFTTAETGALDLRLFGRDKNPRMKSRSIGLTHCPNCGARIVPTSKELRQLRKAAHLTQRQIAERLKVSAAYVAYLEAGKRSPSGAVVARYRKFIFELTLHEPNNRAQLTARQ
jgi:DNA-binding XRE family transcriptional regulator